MYRHPALALERSYDVDDLLPPSGLLDFHDPAATAVRDARLGNLFIGDRIVGRNVARSDDTSDTQDTNLVVDAHLLCPADHEIAVRAKLR